MKFRSLTELKTCISETLLFFTPSKTPRKITPFGKLVNWSNLSGFFETKKFTQEAGY
jgi:hypothetical protein